VQTVCENCIDTISLNGIKRQVNFFRKCCRLIQDIHYVNPDHQNGVYAISNIRIIKSNNIELSRHVVGDVQLNLKETILIQFVERAYL